jgi:hypothetical protein
MAPAIFLTTVVDRLTHVLFYCLDEAGYAESETYNYNRISDTYISK